jgi:hypothetical protein
VPISITPWALLLAVAMFFAHWKFVVLWFRESEGLKWVWGSKKPVPLLRGVRLSLIGAQLAGIVLAIDPLRWVAAAAAIGLFALHCVLLFALSERPMHERHRE